MADTETVQDRILQRLEALGMSPRAASKEALGSPDLIRGILRRPGAVPRGDSLKKLAPVLQTTEQWLLNGDEDGRVAAPVRASSKTGPDWIPVKGTAAGAFADSFRIGAETVKQVPRPPGIGDERDIYAVFVRRSSMEPAHKAGELRFASPHRPPKPGDSVIVTVRHNDRDDEQAYIADLVEETDDQVTVRKLQPASTIAFERRFVIGIHKVLTMNELFGV